VTNESDTYDQAEPGKAPGSTFERKEMSIKTLRKRIALVAVSALAVTGLSTVPANAAIGTATSIAVANTTTDDGTALAVGYYKSNPILDALQISEFTVKAGSAVILQLTAIGGTGFTAENFTRVKLRNFGIVVADHANAVTASGAEDPLPAFTAPSVAGTYYLDVETTTLAAVDGAGTYTANTTLNASVALVVADKSAFSAGVSTIYINDAAAAGTAITDAAGARGISTNGTQAANMTVDLLRADGTTYTSGTFYAYMTGPGTLDILANQAVVDGTGAAYVRSDSLASDAAFSISVAGDGTTGVGTVNMYIILADGTTKVDLGTRSVTFYGTVAKLEAKVLQGIATPGAANGCATANTCTQVTLALTPSVTIKATDANGNVVPGLTISATPADLTVVSTASAVAVTGTTDLNGPGYYNSALTGGTAAGLGKSTTVVYKTTIAATGQIISSAPVTVSLGGTPRTVSWSLDKASYNPGEKIVITVSAKDAAGNPAADGTYANLFTGATTASGSITGSTPAASVELVGGKATYNAFAPGTFGSYTLENTTSTSTGAGAGTKLTGTVTVNNPSEAIFASIVAAIAKLQAAIDKINKRLKKQS